MGACLACEADAVGTMEGSRFYPNPVCTQILETPRLSVGRVRAGGSRERFRTSLQSTEIHVVSYQRNAIRPNRIVGRFREPPARQRLRNTKIVCAISSGYREHSKAAPLHGSRPARPRPAAATRPREGNAPLLVSPSSAGCSGFLTKPNSSRAD